MKTAKYNIEGDVEPGFESILEQFTKFYADGSDKNSQICVYVGDRKVVDVFGSTPGTFPGKQYTADTVTNVWSCGKVVGCVMMGIMRDKRLMQYSDKIAQHWPEFARHGKENVTIKDLMHHESGLSKLKTMVTPEQIQTASVKANKVGEMIEDSVPFWPPYGGERNYHIVSRDLISNEIFRRLEPGGRTMGEFFEQEISKQHGGLDVYLRMDPQQLHKSVNFGLNSYCS